jgi:hypothetical protein
MTATWVFLAYGFAALLAVLLLLIFRAKSWYWHALSVLVALVIGLIPIPEQFNTPQGTLAIGSIFTFLFFWGVAAPLFRQHRREPAS